MKKIVLILIFTTCCIAAYSQRQRKIKIYSPILQAYVKANPALSILTFNYNPYEPIQLKPDTVLFNLRYGQPYNNSYYLPYPDHRFLFEKQFGPFPAEAFNKTIDSFTKKYRPCQYYWYTGKIYRDSVVITIEEACPQKGDDMIFTKVASKFDYKGGSAALTEYLQQTIPAALIPMDAHDSVLYYQLVIKKDSLAHDAAQTDSRHTELEEAIKEALANSKPWIPYEGGGRILNVYVKVFVIIDKGRIIIAGYSRP